MASPLDEIDRIVILNVLAIRDDARRARERLGLDARDYRSEPIAPGIPGTVRPVSEN